MPASLLRSERRTAVVSEQGEISAAVAWGRHGKTMEDQLGVEKILFNIDKIEFSLHGNV